MTIECSIVQDLLPLYEEGLVQPETKLWMEEHLRTCTHCNEELDLSTATIEVEIFKPMQTSEQMHKKVQLKLTIFQIVFVALSFLLAMNTNMISGSFAFIITYFLLGFVTFLFYRSWWLSIVISFLPLFIWSFFDYSYTNINFKLAISLVIGSIFVSLIHTVFTLLGSIVAKLVLNLFKKEGV